MSRTASCHGSDKRARRARRKDGARAASSESARMRATANSLARASRNSMCLLERGDAAVITLWGPSEPGERRHPPRGACRSNGTTVAAPPSLSSSELLVLQRPLEQPHTQKITQTCATRSPSATPSWSRTSWARWAPSEDGRGVMWMRWARGARRGTAAQWSVCGRTQRAG